MASTPVNNSSKRVLSNSSTPSPSSTYAQVTKKAKMPETASSACSQPETTHESLVKSVMAEITDQLKTTISEHVNASVTAMAQSVADIISSTLNDRMTAIESENKRLNEQVRQLTDKINELENHKQMTSKSLDTAEQYSRRSCLRISGVAETPDESTDDIVLNIARACDVEMTLAEIDRSHRVPTRKPSAAGKSHPHDIIVKFVSYRSRAALYSGKSRLKNNDNFTRVYINEDLTRLRASLLRSARQLVKINKVTSAWSHDGRIFVKCIDGSRRLISSIDDINNLQ